MAHRHPRTRTVAAATAPAALALLAASGLAFASSPTAPLAPALPPQPNAPPAGACKPSTSALQVWTPLITSSAPAPVVVDPSMPCRMYRLPDSQTVDRSEDEGRTWTTVFHDTAAVAGPAGAFAAGELRAEPSGALLLAEHGNGDAVVAVAKGGAQWQLADSGIEGQAIDTLVVAPSNPQVAYALTPLVGCAGRGTCTGGSGGVELYVTQDGGTSWQPAAFPTTPEVPVVNCSIVCPRAVQVSVDPADPSHIWLVVNTQDFTVGPVDSLQNTSTAPSLVFESHQLGAAGSWSESGVVQGEVTQLLATRTSRHGLRLYAHIVVTSGFSYGLLLSTDSGQTWSTLAVPSMGSGNAGSFPAVAADPNDQDRMLLVGSTESTTAGGDSQMVPITGVWTTDGFTTWQRTPPVPSFPFEQVEAPQVQQVGQKANPNDMVVADNDPTLSLQVDRSGSFYLQSAYYRSCTPGCSDPTYTLWRYAPPPRPSTGSSSGSTGSTPSSFLVAPQRQTMQLAGSCTPVRSLPSGPLSFDGAQLLYTFYDETGPAPYQGLVHTLDPLSCRDTGTFTVTFDPRDLARVAAATGDTSAATHPVVGTLTYDPNHDVLWLSLTTGPNGDPPIFSVAMTHPSGRDRTLGTARLRFFGSHCTSGAFSEELLSYDFTDDTLWSCDHGAPGHVTLDGRSLPSCMATVESVGVAEGRNDETNWTLVAPNRLIASYEDDQSAYEFNTVDCSVTARYAHSQYSEAQDESEQIACDSLTFGGPGHRQPGLGLPTRAPVTVLWVRNAGLDNRTGSLDAYVVPDGYCPFPTTTRLAPVRAVTRHTPATLCATLTMRGRDVPLAAEPLHFSVATVDLGTAVTDAQGRACVTGHLPLPAASYPSVATFAGDQRYLGSADTGTVTLLGTSAFLPPPAPLRRVLGAILPLIGPPPHLPAAQPGPQPQGDAQIQLQTQAQVETQTTAQTVSQLQPGVAIQLRPQRQLATQTMAAPGTVELPATHRAVAAAAGTMFAVMGMAWRLRTRPRLARARTGVRRPR